MFASRGEIGDPCGVRRLRVGDHPALETPRSKPALEQLEDLAVDHPSLDLSHEGVTVDLVEAALDVSVEHPLGALVGRLPDDLNGLMGGRFGRKPKLWARSRPRISVRGRSWPPPSPPGHAPVGMPSGRVLPGFPGLGMYTLRRAWGGTSWPEAQRRALRGRLHASTPSAPTAAMVTPSTPGAPVGGHVDPRPPHHIRCGRACRKGHGSDALGPAWRCGRAHVGGLGRGPGHWPA